MEPDEPVPADRKNRQPTAKETTVETAGTPCRFIRITTRGKSLLTARR
jgi:hypothetical protein